MGFFSRITGKVKAAAHRFVANNPNAIRIIGKVGRVIKDNWKDVAEAILDSPPPGYRDFLAQHGSEPITSIQVERVPIQAPVHAGIHILSKGQLLKNQIDTHTPHLYHTALIINGKYRVERNHMVEVSNFDGRSKGELRSTGIPVNTNIQTLLDNAQKSVGRKWFVYNPKTSNCQQFDMSVLRANGINTPDLERFVDQGAARLLEGVPDLSALSTAAALLDRARQEYTRLKEPEPRYELDRPPGQDLSYVPEVD